MVWEPPDRQDSIVIQADFIGRAVESRLRDPRGVKAMKRSKVYEKISKSEVWLSPLGAKEGEPPALGSSCNESLSFRTTRKVSKKVVLSVTSLTVLLQMYLQGG